MPNVIDFLWKNWGHTSDLLMKAAVKKKVLVIFTYPLCTKNALIIIIIILQYAQDFRNWNNLHLVQILKTSNFNTNSGLLQ